MSFFDPLHKAIASTIRFFTPAKALEYLARSYVAAKATGSNSRWSPKASSAYGEIKTDWQKTTNRARDLERNNPYVKGFVRRWIAGVVESGTWPKSKVPNSDGKTINADLANDIELRWEKWAETAGANGDSYADIQRLVAWHFLVDGEILVRKVAVAGKPLALEILECDQLDTGKDDGTTIMGGIERDKFGKPVGYWILGTHPGNGSSTSTLVPASEIIHVFMRERASQVRGICHFASIITDLFDTSEFQDATLILARVATAFGVYIKSPNPEDWGSSALTGSNAEDGATPLQYVQPGSISYLRPGEEIQTVAAEQPGNVYDPFVRSRLRGASVGAGISYETFSNDYSQGSYSSARQAMLLERALYRCGSAILDAKLNVPVYRWFLDTESRLGQPPLKLPGYEKDPRPYWRVKFSRPKQEWIDPAKEATGIQTRLSIGLETLTEVAEAEGRDIDEVFATRAAEVARMKELGIFGIDAQVESFGALEPAKENTNDNQ